MKKIFQIVSLSVVGALCLLGGATVRAAEHGGGNVQSYSAARGLDYGTIVALDEADAGRVKVASQARLEAMFGMVIDPQQLSMRVSSGVENETYVATSGTYDVLVSTQGGPIQAGDFLTLSSVNGVAMKADTTQALVFGRAQAGFDGQNGVRSNTRLQDEQGKPSKSVQIGAVPATIEILPNPNEQSTKADVPEFLERVGQAIAEKEVSAIRIYLSLGITAVSLISALVVIYAGVRHAVVSIGRNPMSKKSIFRALFEVILTSALILIIGLFAVYLLLRL